MIDKVTLLSRIEQVIRLSKPKINYEEIAADSSGKKVNQLVDFLLEDFEDDKKPVIRIGSKGVPWVLVNVSNLVDGVAPVYNTLASQFVKPLPLLSEKWLQTEHDPNDKIKFNGAVGKSWGKFYIQYRKAYLEKFVDSLTKAIKDPKVFAPKAFINTTTAQEEGQAFGEGRHVDITQEPLSELKRTDTKDKEGKITSKWDRPRMTAVGNPDPHEHYKALKEAIDSSLTPEDIKYIKNEVNTSAKFAPYFHGGRIQGHAEIIGEYDDDILKAKEDLVNAYIERYVDKNGNFTKEAPKEWKRKYEEAQTEALAHREGENIAGYEEGDKQILPDPWYRQLGVERIHGNPAAGQPARGTWYRRNKDGSWKKFKIVGDAVYRVPGIGDVIVQIKEGLGTRIFAPSFNSKTREYSPELNIPRVFPTDKASDTMVRLYFEKRIPLPEGYNPPPINEVDLNALVTINNRLYEKAKKGALELSGKERESALEAVEEKYAKWKASSVFKGPIFEQAWEDWFVKDFTKAVKPEVIKRFKQIEQRVDERKKLSTSDSEFYDETQRAIEDFKKKSRKEFKAQYLMHVIAPFIKELSPLDSPDAYAKEDNSKALAEDALNSKISKIIEATPEGKEYRKWKNLINKAQETAWKDKNKAEEGDFEDEAAEAEENKASSKDVFDSEGNIIKPGWKEEAPKTLGEVEDTEEDKEVPEEEQDMTPEAAEEDIDETDSEERAPKDIKPSWNMAPLEKERLDWLEQRASMARSAVRLKWYQARATFADKVQTVRGLYNKNHTKVYDLEIVPGAKKPTVLKVTPLSTEEINKGQQALNNPKEELFLSPAFNKIPSKEASKVVWNDVLERTGIGREPPPDPEERGPSTPTPHFDWTNRLQEAIKIAREKKDDVTLRALHTAYPDKVGRYYKLTSTEIKDAKKQQATKEAAKSRILPPPTQDWNVNIPNFEEGESGDEFRQKVKDWGEDLKIKYEKASPEVKEEMKKQYAHFVSANPTKWHPFDKVEELKPIKQEILDRTNGSSQVTSAIADINDRFNDRAYRNTLRNNITKKNEENKKLGQEENIIRPTDMDEALDELLKEGKEQAIKKVEASYNVKVDRKTGAYKVNKEGLKIPPEPTPERRTMADYGEEPAIIKPKRKWMDAFNDSFFHKPNETGQTFSDTSSVKPKRKWMDAFNDPFFGGSN